MTGWAACNAVGWPAHTWILHAMYETDQLPRGLTHDDVHRAELGAGTKPPTVIGDVNLDETPGVLVTGGRLRRSGSPGAGWTRLRWLELAARLRVDLLASGSPPCGRWFPYGSWPVNTRPPAEGSPDLSEQPRSSDRPAISGQVTGRGSSGPTGTCGSRRSAVHAS